jgi:hypothetical protein
VPGCDGAAGARVPGACAVVVPVAGGRARLGCRGRSSDHAVHGGEVCPRLLRNGECPH